MAQSVKRLIRGFGAGRDLLVRRFKHCMGFVGSSTADPAWDSLSLPLSAPPQLVCSLSLSLKINKHLKN